MKIQILTAFLALMASSVASARQFTLVKGSGYAIEPLYGYETVYRSSPSPHIATRAMYGVRLSAGVDLLSGEAEYSRASDTETFSGAPEKVYHEDENYKLGIRSTYRFNQYFFSSARLGAQATKGFEESTSSGVVTRKDKDLKYNPYAGAQVGVKLGVFSVNLSATMVFRDYSDLSKNDVQHTLSFGVGY